MAHDPKCYELAKHFLDNKPGADESDISALAEVIQQAVDDWFDGAGFED